MSDPTDYVRSVAVAARAAAEKLALTGGDQRDSALQSAADAIRRGADEVLRANADDLAEAERAGLSPAMIDRLRLTEGRVEAMSAALEAIAAQPNPVGATLEEHRRPDGLVIEKRRVPLGVVAIIYESRPNVTADAAGLCLKSANACILRGGRESLRTNLALGEHLRAGLAAAAVPADSVCIIDRTDRRIVPALATAEGLIDLIIPRGGEGLIRAVVSAATIPVIKHYAGNCHVYVHADADAAMARKIVLNAKCQRPGVCNAMETLVIHADLCGPAGPAAKILADLLDAGVELRGDEAAGRLNPNVKPATQEDWTTEYLALVLAVRVVGSLDEAIDHVNTYGSRHTDAIVTASDAAARAFVARVDSSSVMVNASTRFSDGGEYGLGAEIGISTDKLHARGPMGAADLTTYKWVVTGSGHVRR